MHNLGCNNAPSGWIPPLHGLVIRHCITIFKYIKTCINLPSKGLWKWKAYIIDHKTSFTWKNRAMGKNFCNEVTMGSEPLISMAFCCQDLPSLPFPPFPHENTIGAISNFGSKFVTPSALINSPETMDNLINPITTFLNCLYRIAGIIFWRLALAKHWMNEPMKVTPDFHSSIFQAGVHK